MINTKRLNIKQLVARIEQADPSIEIGKIEVQGDVNGHIVVGHGNVVGNHNIVYQSHSLFGAFINRDSSYVDIQKRPPSEPPHPPLRFVGRQRELSALEEHIGTRQPVLLYGQSGMGKTTLLQKAAHSEAAKSMPDGVIYLESLYEGNISSPEDILQRLFDRMFDSQPPVKLTHPRTLVKANLTGTHPFGQALERLFPKWFGPTTLFDPARIEGELARLKALILLDEPGIEQKALDRMARLLSASAVLVSDQTAPLDDVYESIRLKPLPREDAIQLFIKKSDIELDAKTRPVIEKICEILEDIPLAIATLANGVRQDRFQINTPDGPELQALIYLLEEFQPLSQDPVQAAIERSLKVLYRHLNWREQEMLSDVVSAPGRSVERELLENEGPGAEEAVEQVERLELLYANSPRMRLPQGLREVVRSIEAGLETPPRIQGFLEYLRTELRKHNPDSDFIAAELGNLLGILEWAFDTKQWEAVIELGQAVDPYLALHGLWDTWETVLKQVETAAQISKKPLARAWALHQLGTREIGIGTRRRAIELLRHALEIRIRKREFAAAVYTLHNLRFLLPAGPNGDEDGKDEPDTPRPKPGEVIRTYVETFFASLVGLALVTTLLLQPSMRFQIESTPTSYSPSGQLIEYSYTVDNAGIRQFAGPIFVTTEDQAEVTCPDLEDIGDQDSVLDWNESITCTSFYTISEADAESESVTNTATASAGESGLRATRSFTLRRDDRYVLLDIETEPRTFAKAGDTITVAYLVNNAGKAALRGLIAVTGEPLQVNCPGAQQANAGNRLLEAGQSLVCTSSYVITKDDVQAGFWTNTASVSVGNFKSDPQKVTIFGLPPSPLTLKKSAETTIYRQAGEAIEFAYEVANQGEDPLKGPVSVSDDNVEVTCPGQDDVLDPGERILCRGTYTVTEADIENGSVTTTATARTQDMESEAQSLTLTYEGPEGVQSQTVMLRLTKSANPVTYNAVGQTITYSYEVTNRGTGPVQGPVTVSDDKAQVTCDAHDNVLNPDEMLKCSATYTITEADIKQKSVTNSASANIGGYRSPQQITVIAYSVPLPVLLKSAEPKTYQYAGQEIKYTYVVANPGTSSINGPVTVKDDIAQVDCSQPIMPVQQVNVLNPGELFVCTGRYVITDADVQKGSVTNTAWAIVGGLTSDAKSVTIYAEAAPTNLTLRKSARPGSYQQVGERIHYSYFVVNEGRAPLKGSVTIEDDHVQVVCPSLNVIGDLDDLLDPGERLTCIATYTITEADLRNGAVTNTALARVGKAGSNPSAETVYARALNLVGAADALGYEQAGKAIQYTYEVTSQSKLPLSGPVTVTIDNNRIRVTCEELAKIGNQDDAFDWNEALPCTASYSTTQADIDTIPEGSDHGSVTITASASAGGLTSNRVTVSVSGPQPRPELRLIKSADTDTFDSVGQVITYTYAVTNTGNVTLPAPVRITDDLVNNRQAFNCGDNQQGLAPQGQVTCTGTYTILEADFGPDVVTGNTTAAVDYRGAVIESAPAQNTATCPPPPTGWIPYTVEDRVGLGEIDSWYADLSAADLQRRNCMASSATVSAGQVIFVPRPPPPAIITGVVRDAGNAPLANILVQLISGGNVVDSAYTDRSGTYTLSAQDPGTYQIFRLPVPLERGDNPPQNFVILPTRQ